LARTRQVERLVTVDSLSHHLEVPVGVIKP
jgi:hypothetical protein